MAERLKYRNGDFITLQAIGCDGCSPSMINKVLCHESGCPERWRDMERDCFQCGEEFMPGDRTDSICADCMEQESIWHDIENDV